MAETSTTCPLVLASASPRRRELLAAAAAWAFGAGFGGAVWALVASADADGSLCDWADGCAKSFPERAPAELLLTAAGPGTL